MIKSLLIMLLICATLVHAAKKTAKQSPSQSKNSSAKKEEVSDDESEASDEDESSDEEDDDDDDSDTSSKSKSKNPKSTSAKSKQTDIKSKKDKKGDDYPSLTCILFSDIGCNTECIMIGAMYNLKTEGSCNVRNFCECTSSEDSSLETLWKRKFNSNALLREIKKKPSLAKQVQQKLKQPFRTEKQSKQDLKSVLSSDQFKKLRPLETSLASELTKSNGKLDYGKIESYVLGVLRWVMPLPNNRLRGVKYQNKLRSALNTTKNKESLQHIIGQVRQSKNKDLTNIVDQYVKKSKFKEQSDSKSKQKDTAQTLEDFIGYTIIDEFISYIKYHTWLSDVTSIPFQPPCWITWLPPPPVYVPPPPQVYIPPPPPVYIPPPPPVVIPPMPPMPPMTPMTPMSGYYY